MTSFLWPEGLENRTIWWPVGSGDDDRWVGHYNDIIMRAIASQITSLTIVYSTVCQRKHQSSASLAFVRGIHRWPVNSPHKWPVTRKMFPFDDVIMNNISHCIRGPWSDTAYLQTMALCLVTITTQISRSHRVGQKRNDGTPRPILVKFISYRAREQVFKARRLLPQGVYVNEDLTQATAQLAYQARQLRRNGLIDETWTYDGRVFIKKNGRSRGVLVRSLEDLVETLHDGDDSDEEGRKIAPQQKTPKPGSVRPTKPNTKPTGAADKILSNLNKSSKATPNQKPSHSQGLTSTPINRNPTTTPTPRSKAKRNTNEMTLPVPEHGETINPHDYDLASTNENHTIDDQSAISEELCPMNAYLRDKLESFDHSKEDNMDTLDTSQDKKR